MFLWGQIPVQVPQKHVAALTKRLMLCIRRGASEVCWGYTLLLACLELAPCTEYSTGTDGDMRYVSTASQRRVSLPATGILHRALTVGSTGRPPVQFASSRKGEARHVSWENVQA